MIHSKVKSLKVQKKTDKSTEKLRVEKGHRVSQGDEIAEARDNGRLASELRKPSEMSAAETLPAQMRSILYTLHTVRIHGQLS